MKPRFILSGFLALAIMGTGVHWLRGHVKLAWNETESLPQHLFWVRTDQKPDRGDYVLFESPKDVNSRYAFIKRVAGEKIGIAKTISRKDTPLNTVTPGLIPPGYYFVHTNHRDSYDSRYQSIGLASLAALLPYSEATAKDLGVRGQVWEISETDLLVYIKSKAAEFEKSGKLEAWQNDAKTHARSYVETPNPVTGITNAIVERNRPLNETPRPPPLSFRHVNCFENPGPVGKVFLSLERNDNGETEKLFSRVQGLCCCANIRGRGKTDCCISRYIGPSFLGH